MNRLKILIGLLPLVLLTACSSVIHDIEVETEADPKVRFEGYMSYAWLGMTNIMFDDEGRWIPPDFDADAEIKFFIDRELKKRGLVINEVLPEMAVYFATGVDMDSLKPIKDAKNKMKSLINVPQGALVIVLLDVVNRYPIWIGVATADLHPELDAASARKRLDYAVTKMLKQIPK